MYICEITKTRIRLIRIDKFWGKYLRSLSDQILHMSSLFLWLVAAILVTEKAFRGRPDVFSSLKKFVLSSYSAKRYMFAFTLLLMLTVNSAQSTRYLSNWHALCWYILLTCISFLIVYLFNNKHLWKQFWKPLKEYLNYQYSYW